MLSEAPALSNMCMCSTVLLLSGSQFIIPFLHLSLVTDIVKKAFSHCDRGCGVLRYSWSSSLSAWFWDFITIATYVLFHPSLTLFMPLGNIFVNIGNWSLCDSTSMCVCAIAILFYSSNVGILYTWCLLWPSHICYTSHCAMPYYVI